MRINIKVLLIALFLFCGIASESQIYTPVNPTIFGSNNNRIKALDAIGFPAKDTTLSTNDLSPQIFYRPADSSFWGFSEDKRFFKLGTGGDGSGIDVDAFHKAQQGLDSSHFNLIKPNGDTVSIFFSADATGGGTAVQSVTGTTVDNTDPLNPVVSTPNFNNVADASHEGLDDFAKMDDRALMVVDNTNSGTSFLGVANSDLTKAIQIGSEYGTESPYLDYVIGANGVTVKADSVTGGVHILYLPSSDGTLVSTVNNRHPDKFGNVTVSGGSTPSLQDVIDINDTVSTKIVLGWSGVDFLDPISTGAKSSLSFYDNQMRIYDRYGNLNSIAFPRGSSSGGVYTYYTLPMVGQATLSSGTVTVSNDKISSGAIIVVSVATPSGTQGFLSVPSSSIIDYTSFVINSTSSTENSVVNYIIYPAAQ